MGKADHPAYQKADVSSKEWTPHLLPSVFERGIYFLHQTIRGKHEVTLVPGEALAQEMLKAAIERSESN